MAKADAFAGIDDATRFGFLLIGVGLATGLVVAWLGGHYFISRPIDRLARAAAQWGRGNFAARTGLESGPIRADPARRHLRHDGRAAASGATGEHQLAGDAGKPGRGTNRVLETTNHELRSEMERRERAEDTLRHCRRSRRSAS